MLFFFYLNTVKVLELMGGNGCGIIQTINSKTTKKTARTTKSTRRVLCAVIVYFSPD